MQSIVRFFRRGRAGLVALLATAYCNSFSAEAVPCDSGQLSHAAESECLSKEYQGADALLRQKVEQMIRIAEPRDMLSAPADRVAEERKRLQDQIRRADRLWRQLLDVECDALITASFGKGNGHDLASLNCRIARTGERIAF